MTYQVPQEWLTVCSTTRSIFKAALAIVKDVSNSITCKIIGTAVEVKKSMSGPIAELSSLGYLVERREEDVRDREVWDIQIQQAYNKAVGF